MPIPFILFMLSIERNLLSMTSVHDSRLNSSTTEEKYLTSHQSRCGLQHYRATNEKQGKVDLLEIKAILVISLFRKPQVS
ncbi:MAG: hypothetical protein JRN19_00870 [Nitrososphaerota archaeon]|nr:hypothetical protein [Nitrososphaerota archaeon]MDG7049439.1 hypothetical protein [Nitrososphaerota archaeon]MDG7051000.1 hypothetical protein [Nitrososphaerota archaeon]